MEILRRIGRGSFGEVSEILATDPKSGLRKTRALKTGEFGELEKMALSCGSRYVPKLHSDLGDKIIMEYVSEKISIYNNFNACYFAYELLAGITDCYDQFYSKYNQNIVHCDIKDANLGVKLGETENKLKILDWGTARNPLTTKIHQNNMDGLCLPIGTVTNAPPESILKDYHISEKYDSWSIGATLFNWAAKTRTPYEVKEDFYFEIAILLKMCELNPPTKIIDKGIIGKCEKEKIRFANRILQLDQIATIPKDFTQILLHLLNPDEEERTTPRETLEFIIKDLDPDRRFSSETPEPSRFSSVTVCETPLLGKSPAAFFFDEASFNEGFKKYDDEVAAINAYTLDDDGLSENPEACPKPKHLSALSFAHTIAEEGDDYEDDFISDLSSILTVQSRVNNSSTTTPRSSCRTTPTLEVEEDVD
jgi:serine/threonine protein kinase